MDYYQFMLPTKKAHHNMLGIIQTAFFPDTAIPREMWNIDLAVLRNSDRYATEISSRYVELERSIKKV